jgi:hypothetical protein
MRPDEEPDSRMRNIMPFLNRAQHIGAIKVCQGKDGFSVTRSIH